MKQFSFVLYDFTTDKTPDHLRPVTSFRRMIAAALEQIQGPMAREYGSVICSFRHALSADDRIRGEIAINFRDEIPEAPGALAYHQVTDGVPDIELGCDLFSSLVDDSESISGGFTHEISELLGDPGANEWADKGNGLMAAKERCDVVQNTGYLARNGVWVSNFLRQSYFIPGSDGPWDYLGVMKSQDDISNGYEIQARSPTQVEQVNGLVLHGSWARAVENLSELALKRKAKHHSRTARRGVVIHSRLTSEDSPVTQEEK